MKLLLSSSITFITSVTFLYYLFNNPNFTHLKDTGNYNWLNIFTLIILITLAIFSLLNIFLYVLIKAIRKNKEVVGISIMVFKISLFVTLGLLVVFVLNFFNILSWMWGISILVVVLVSLLII